MFSVVTRTLRLVAQRWPQLLAWYLAGWLVRYLVIELAAIVGTTSALLAFLIMPIAILARLGSFIAMFLVLRGAMPGYQELSLKGQDAIEDAAAPRRPGVSSIFLASIVPFFAFYAAWKLLQGDTVQYAASALAKSNPFDGPLAADAILGLSLDWVTGSIIVVAFAARFVLGRFASRLPRWTTLITVYLEAVWVYLTVFLINDYLGQVTKWVDGRAATVWLRGVGETVAGFFAPIGFIWDGIAWVIGEAGGVVLLPLAWLSLAGIVYGRALATPRVEFRPRGALYARASQRLAALPKGVLRRMRDVASDVADRGRPLANALLLIWRAGVVPMGVFVLAYTVVVAATDWLFLAAIQVIEPHELFAWWANFDTILSFSIELVLEPVRICLVAAAYDFCLRRLGERREAAMEAAS